MATLNGLFTLGRDAELKTTPSGTSVCELALAYNYGMKGQDGKKPSQWLRASLWGKQGEVLAQHLTKGKQVSACVDDLHVRSFTKQDGSAATSLEGRVIAIELVRGQRQESAAPAPRPAPAPPPAQRSAGSGFDDMDSDIPFRDPLSYRGAHWGF